MTSFNDSLLTVMMAQQETEIKGDHSSGLGRQGNGYDFYTQVSLRLTAQMVLLLLHVSAENHSHLLVRYKCSRHVQRTVQVVKYRR